MDASLGRIKAHLAGSSVGRLAQLVRLINDNINPPEAVGEDDVHIRAMYIVSNEVNSFGGRFPEEELSRLTELLVDSPVMVGHRKDRLPVARTFHARLVERDGRQWVKSYFYWLRSANGAEDLKENIDGGIYKECSIGFTYRLPECSICGKDIRSCRHEPLTRYESNDPDPVCHFNYREIERVLETSLVYRGAVPDTAMSKELANDSDGEEPGTGDVTLPLVIASPSELPLDKSYLVIPAYESIPVRVLIDDGEVSFTQVDGDRVDSELITNLKLIDLTDSDEFCGYLIGYRGKERCSVERLRKHLARRGGSVTRVELKLLPHSDREPVSGVIRHEFCVASELDTVARRLATRNGVRIWQADHLPPDNPGYEYVPEATVKEQAGLYRVIVPSNGKDALLEISDGETTTRYLIRQFHAARFKKGGRFIGDALDDDHAVSASDNGCLLSGSVGRFAVSGEGLFIDVEGALTGRIAVQPIKIHRRNRYLFSLSSSDRAGESHE